MSESLTLAKALPLEQARVREIQQHAREIGPPGAFLVAMCERALVWAEQAAAAGDTVEMLRALEELKGFE